MKAATQYSEVQNVEKSTQPNLDTALSNIKEGEKMTAGLKELLDEMKTMLEEVGLGSLENWLDGLNFELDVKSW